MIPTPAGRIPAVTETLLALGFQPQTVPSAFPPTRPMAQGVARHHGHPYRAHVHVVPAGSPEVVELRAFRDALRADLDLRDAYVALKRTLIASGITDPVDFSQAKHDFVDAALRGLGMRRRSC